MSCIVTIFRREFASYFDTPLAYIVISVFLVLVAAFSLWFQDIFALGVISLRVVYFWSAVFFLFLVPAVTMRLFAEEWRTGTLEVLLTQPIRYVHVVVGKYLAAVALVAVALLLTTGYAITLSFWGDLELGPVIGAYLGLLLLGAAWAAIGTAASAATSNQVVAFLVAFLICLVPFALGFFLHRVPSALIPVAQYLSFDYHFDNLARGVIDTRDLVFYGSVVVLGLAASAHLLEVNRLGRGGG